MQITGRPTFCKILNISRNFHTTQTKKKRFTQRHTLLYRMTHSSQPKTAFSLLRFSPKKDLYKATGNKSKINDKEAFLNAYFFICQVLFKVSVSNHKKKEMKTVGDELYDKIHSSAREIFIHACNTKQPTLYLHW